MHEIRWSEAAADDLAGIIEYLADVNAIVAQRYGEDFRQLIELLKFMPDIFRVWEVDEQFRCCALVKPYLIIYQVNHTENFIRITRIIHGKRQSPQVDAMPV